MRSAISYGMLDALPTGRLYTQLSFLYPSFDVSLALFDIVLYSVSEVNSVSTFQGCLHAFTSRIIRVF